MSSQRFKVVLLGEGRVGKTSILLRFTKGQYDDRQVSTLQASYLDKKVSVGSTTANLSIWDTAGQERFHALSPIYYRDADGALLGLLVHRADSLEDNTSLYTVVDSCMLLVNLWVPIVIVWKCVDYILEKTHPYRTLKKILFSKDNIFESVSHYLAVRAHRAAKAGHQIAQALHLEKRKKQKVEPDMASLVKKRARAFVEGFISESSEKQTKRTITSRHLQREDIAPSLVSDVILEAVNLPTFRKSRKQQKHICMRGRRKMELVFMRNNFMDLLKIFETQGNNLVNVLDHMDPDVTLDELNAHKRHLEDVLTAAENQLVEQRAERDKILVQQGMPYDILGNMGDVSRLNKNDQKYFETHNWIPPEYSLEDNRMDRSCIRPASFFDYHEDNYYINIEDKLDEAGDILRDLDGYQISEESSYLSDASRDSDDFRHPSGKWMLEDGPTDDNGVEIRPAETLDNVQLSPTTRLDQEELNLMKLRRNEHAFKSGYSDSEGLYNVSDSIYSLSEYSASETSYETATESGTEYDTVSESEDDSSIYSKISGSRIRLVNLQNNQPIHPKPQYPTTPRAENNSSLFSVSTVLSSSSSSPTNSKESSSDLDSDHFSDDSSDSDSGSATSSDDEGYDQAIHL